MLKTEINKLRKRIPPVGVIVPMKSSILEVNDFNDMDRNREDMKALKRELNLVKDENRILLSKNEQYKKRATYAK